MKCVIAFDGSPDASTALNLAAGVDWPPDSAVRIVSVIEPIIAPISGPLHRSAPIAPEIDAAVTEYVNETNSQAVKHFGAKVAVDGAVVRGRAATAIADAATSYSADLVVAGSRGRGAITSLVLGSVSSELVDEAPCPVLIARRETISRVLFATDGSASANAAEDALTRWPLFTGVPLHVVSVAQTFVPWTIGLAPTAYSPRAMELYTAELDELRGSHERIAKDAVTRLRRSGHNVDSSVRSGIPATEILAAADELAADLIVVGSRGLSGLSRVLLGSVARNVLHGAKSSVAIFREMST